jgi:hypothetical protein
MLLMSVADSAQAEQKPDSGTDVMVADNKIIEVGKDHTVILIDQKGIETTTDPSMPTNMTMIDCVGMAEALPDKTWKGNGYCTLTDKDGDKVYQRWTGSSELNGSRYEIVGGTGKFEGGTGGGKATDIELSGGPQARIVTRWEGTSDFPKFGK